MGKCIGNNEKGISGETHDFGVGEKREAVGILISHLGDLLVSGSGAFIAYFSVGLGN